MPPPSHLSGVRTPWPRLGSLVSGFHPQRPLLTLCPSSPLPLCDPRVDIPPLTFLSNPAPRSRLGRPHGSVAISWNVPPVVGCRLPSPTQSHRHRAYGAALLRRLDRQATTLQTSPGAPFWWAAGRQHFPFPSHPPQPSVPAHSLDTVSSSVAFYPPSAPLSLARLQVDLSSLRTLLP
jgi:hypothetical protein